MLNLHHVESWDSFGNADNQFNLGFNSFHNGSGSEGRGDVHNRCFAVSVLFGLSDVLEHWESQVHLSSLLGVDSSNHVGSIGNGLLSVKGTL